jgi:hypothetical protein
MEQRGPRWESDYAEFVAAYSARLRRQAYVQCGDWFLADRALARVLRTLYRRWPALGEPPEVFAERRLADEARRLRPAGAVTASQDDLAPAATVETARLIVQERRRRRRVRLVGAAVSVVALAAAGGGLVVLRPPPDGGPVPRLDDCMSEVPRTPLPQATGLTSAGTQPTGGDGPPSTAVASGPPNGGVDRLITVADRLPLPGSSALPADQISTRQERMACALADLIMRLVNPSALERIDLGLEITDTRPLWPQADPQYGTALTTSLRLMTPSGISTATVTIAQTNLLPSTSHCARLAICQTSNRGDQGQIIEQYGVRSSTAAESGLTLGDGAAWWAMLVYTGHTLVSLTITNTPDVRAASPATQRASPLSPQSASFATDPRLALFDPPAASGGATASPQPIEVTPSPTG